MRLLALKKRNQEVLSNLPESEFSVRIKLKSNLVIISTELQTIDDQIEASRQQEASSKPSPKPKGTK